MVKKLILVEESGTIKVKSVVMTEAMMNGWERNFIVDQYNLGDQHPAFLMHVYVSKQKK